MARFNPNTYNPADDSSEGTWELNLPGVALIQGEGICPCGCTDHPKGTKSRFVMGHDARLKGKLIRAHITDTPVHLLDEGGNHVKDTVAMEVARELGPRWTRHLEAAQERVAQKANRRGMKVGDVLRTKVGRWEYDAKIVAIEGDQVEVQYTTKGGDTKAATKPLAEVAG